MSCDQEVPKELEAIARKVLAYKPKAKTKAAKGRKRKAKKMRTEKQSYSNKLT